MLRVLSDTYTAGRRFGIATAAIWNSKISEKKVNLRFYFLGRHVSEKLLRRKSLFYFIAKVIIDRSVNTRIINDHSVKLVSRK